MVGSPSEPGRSLEGSSPRKGRRVLIVDDQLEMARALARVLGNEATVTVVTSGAAALSAIEGESAFHLVICDVMMPEMTGPQLFDRVREIDPRTAALFVFTSGGVPEEQRSHLLSTGVRCLTKPVDLAALRALLRE